MSNVIDFSSRLKQRTANCEAQDRPLCEMTREEQVQYLDRLERRLEVILDLIEAEMGSDEAPHSVSTLSAKIGADIASGS